MTNKPAISVIMSAYNAEKYIAEAIESILNQTFNDFEFIIFEDGSTDKTKEIIKKYAKIDKRIKPTYNKSNIGHIGFVRNLNKGLKMARGKYIARMDADDISMSERFKKQHSYLETHQDIFLIGTGAINIDLNGNKIGEFNPITHSKTLITQLEKNNLIYHPSIMFRNKGFNYRYKIFYAEDYDFYLNLISSGKLLANLDELLIKYRISENSVSHSNRVKQTLFAQVARDFYKQRLKYKRDGYNKFDPNSILNIEISKLKDTNLILLEMRAAFNINNLIKARKIARSYFKRNGYFNMVLFYYLFTFIGKRNICLLKKFTRT